MSFFTPWKTMAVPISSPGLLNTGLPQPGCRSEESQVCTCGAFRKNPRIVKVADGFIGIPESLTIHLRHQSFWVFPKNRGTPKSSTLIGFSINHPFWGYHHFRKHQYVHLWSIHLSHLIPLNPGCLLLLMAEIRLTSWMFIPSFTRFYTSQVVQDFLVVSLIGILTMGLL